MLRMSTAIVPIFIVSLTGLACSDQSTLNLRGGSGGQPAAGSGGNAGGGGVGGSQAGSGGPPDAGADGAGLGGAIGSGGIGSGGTSSGGAGGATSCSTAVCFLPACVGGEFQPNPADPCGCPICVIDGGAPMDGGKKDASADSSPDLHICGPVCDIYCQYGNVLDPSGCPTCQCKPAPTCPAGSHAVTCSTASACTLDCDEYERGADGCQRCACKTPATCAPPGAATCIYCPFGYRAGPGGCITCSCADPPIGCAADSSDAGA